MLRNCQLHRPWPDLPYFGCRIFSERPNWVPRQAGSYKHSTNASVDLWDAFPLRSDGDFPPTKGGGKVLHFAAGFLHPAPPGHGSHGTLWAVACVVDVLFTAAVLDVGEVIAYRRSSHWYVVPGRARPACHTCFGGLILEPSRRTVKHTLALSGTYPSIAFLCPSKLDQPAGHEMQDRSPIVVPATQGLVLMHTSYLLQFTAVQPLDMLTKEDPPTAMEPRGGVVQPA